MLEFQPINYKGFVLRYKRYGFINILFKDFVYQINA